MTKYLSFGIFLIALFVGMTGLVDAYLDDFDGPDLHERWTYRDPGGKGEYQLEGGKLVLKLKAGADMYKQGVDSGVMFLMDPPDMDDFSVLMHVNVATNNGKQPPSCQVGIVFFREDEWAYSAWGPYNAGRDIRVEDCIGQDYRWRDQAQIGIDAADVAVDEDVYLKVVKTGDNLEFFAAADGAENWISGGGDAKLGPHYERGMYQVGIIAKSWGGSIDSEFEMDFFDIPEIPSAVDAGGKLAVTWGTLKQ